MIRSRCSINSPVSVKMESAWCPDPPRRRNPPVRDSHPVPEVCRKGIAVATTAAAAAAADERRRLYLNHRGLVGVAVSTDAPRKTRTRSRTERPDNPRDLFFPRVSSPPPTSLRRCVGVQAHGVPARVASRRWRRVRIKGRGERDD